MTRLFCAGALLLASCATVDATRPIERQEHWYGTGYAQEGHVLHPTRIASQLENEEGAQPHVARYRAYERWTIPLGVAGGAAIGWGSARMLQGRTRDWPWLAAGAATLIPYSILIVYQQRALRDAVDAHNATLALKAPAATCAAPAAPWVAVAPSPDGGWSAAAGLRGAW